ncbi:AlpA family transcriptional regulator [Nocardiopsis sp. FIRDI 009]|uniref:helix-turn-helix transcriptional regulator n=1 Tax=Nocardiopsis sp. FIRDI 009 TaxID=714197 RepID=UPI000E272121|nr:helix-turn-helix domain-containing protein [Nocardiopsis sp. FIRDI 009]
MPKNAIPRPRTPDPLLTLPEVLAELKVPRSTFDDWRKKGLAPRYAKLPNGQLRVRRSDLDNWLAERMGEVA